MADPDTALAKAAEYKQAGDHLGFLSALESLMGDPDFVLKDKIPLMADYAYQQKKDKSPSLVEAQPKACEVARLIAKAHPDQPEAHVLCGSVLYLALKYDEAFACYDRAVELDSTVTSAYEFLKIAVRRIYGNAYKEAKAKATASGDDPYLTKKSDALRDLTKGRVGEARGLHKNDNMDEITNNIGTLYVGDLKEILSLEKDPQMKPVWEQYIYCISRQNSTVEKAYQSWESDRENTVLARLHARTLFNLILSVARSAHGLEIPQAVHEEIDKASSTAEKPQEATPDRPGPADDFVVSESNSGPIVSPSPPPATAAPADDPFNVSESGSGPAPSPAPVKATADMFLSSDEPPAPVAAANDPFNVSESSGRPEPAEEPVEQAPPTIREPEPQHEPEPEPTSAPAEDKAKWLLSDDDTEGPVPEVEQAVVVIEKSYALVGFQDTVVEKEQNSFSIEVRDQDGRLVEGGEEDGFFVWFDSDGYIEHDLADNRDGTYTVTYSASEAGQCILNVKIGSNRFGDPFPGTPLDFTVSGAGKAWQPPSEPSEEAAAATYGSQRYEERQEEREPDRAPPTREPLDFSDSDGPAVRRQPRDIGDVQPGSDPQMEREYATNLLVNTVFGCQKTFHTLNYEVGDLHAVVNQVLNQLNALEEKQDTLVMEWKRSEMRRYKMGLEVKEMIDRCNAAGVEVNRAFFEEPEDFELTLARINTIVHGDVESSQLERRDMREAMVREMVDVRKQVAEQEKLLGDILRFRVVQAEMPEATRAPEGEGAENRSHDDSRGSRGGERQFSEESYYHEDSQRRGGRQRQGGGGGQAALDHAYEVARAEIRNMKSQAQKASIRHSLTQARVKQLEVKLEEDGAFGGTPANLPGIGKRRMKPGAVGEKAWREKEARYQAEMDRVSVRAAEEGERASNLQLEKTALMKKLRDIKKEFSLREKKMQAHHVATLADLKRKHENELESKRMEFTNLKDEMKIQKFELRANLRNKHHQELVEADQQNERKAAAIREELDDLRVIIDRDTNAFGGLRSERRGGSPTKHRSPRRSMRH